MSQKQKLIALVRHYNDEAPREILLSMKVKELQRYLDELRKYHPDLVATENQAFETIQ